MLQRMYNLLHRVILGRPSCRLKFSRATPRDVYPSRYVKASLTLVDVVSGTRRSASRKCFHWPAPRYCRWKAYREEERKKALGAAGWAGLVPETGTTPPRISPGASGIK